MQHHRIYSYRTGEILFSGIFADFKTCVEAAVIRRISLSYADFSHRNLHHANLDDAVMKEARFDGANLVGGNLSEAQLAGASFANTSLQNTCFCGSDLTEADFHGALFGATDIADAVLDGAGFDTISALSLNFRDTQSMEACRFEEEGAIAFFSAPPLVLNGDEMPVAAFDTYLKIGGVLQPYEAWFGPQPPQKTGPVLQASDGRAHVFFQKRRGLLQALAAQKTGYAPAGASILCR